VDAQGFSDGLVTRWKDTFENTNFVYLISRIVVGGRGNDVDKFFKLVNLYALYRNKLQLWNNLKKQ
jgi:hypothetical protein